MSTPTIERLNEALAGRYRVDREVGEGGMALVYLAEDLRHHRNVALKVLKPELAATMGPERFLHEVRVTANLQHPHILPLFDSGESDGFLYYVMPYLEGESLRERIAREGELPVSEAVGILAEVVDALSAAHAAGVVHRDIKPDNVMLSGRHAVVTDFGVAKAVREAAERPEATTKGVALGTPTYMAPEQAAANENVDHRADIYAVGAMGYELLAGRPPFSARTAQQILAAHVTETPRPVSELRATVPEAVAAVIMRCLEKKPADRWQTADELHAQLQTFATPSTGTTPAQMTPVKAGAGVPAWAKVAAPVAVAVVAFGLWAATRGGGTNPAASGTGSAAAGAAGVEAVLERDRLIVMPLENLTGDPEVDVWSMLAAEMIANAIDRPRPIDVVPATAVRDALKAPGSDGSVSAVAERVAASHAVAGTLARTGDQVRFQVEFLDARTGERLRALDPVTGSVDSVQAVVARLADAAAVASVLLLDPGAPPWAQVSSFPPSLAAYERYLEAGDHFCRSQYRESIEAADRAREIAPDFAAPLLLSRTAYANLGLNEEADSVTAMIERVRDQLTNVERLEQDWMLGNLEGDPLLATRAAEEAFRISPWTQYGYMAGLTALRTGRVSEAVERLATVDVDAPCTREWRPQWNVLATTYHLLGRYEEELSVARDGLRRFPGHRPLMDREGRALAALGQAERVDSLIRAMDALPPQQGYVTDLRPALAALELRAHGREEEGRALLEESVTRFRALPPSESRYQRGRVYYWAGHYEDADTTFASLLEEAPENWNYLTFRGAALARLGRVEEAQAVSNRLADLDVPGMRGRDIAGRVYIAAALGRNAEAVSLLQRAFANGYAFGTQFHTDPTFDRLRDDPQWRALTTPR